MIEAHRSRSETICFSNIDLTAIDLGSTGVGVGVIDLENPEVHVVEVDLRDIGIAGTFENQGVGTSDRLIEAQEAIGIALGGGSNRQILAKSDRQVDVNSLALARHNRGRNMLGGLARKNQGVATEDQAAATVSQQELIEEKTRGQIILDRLGNWLVKAQEIVGLAGDLRGRFVG